MSEYEIIKDNLELYNFLTAIAKKAMPMFRKMGVAVVGPEEILSDVYFSYRYLSSKYSPDRGVPFKSYIAKYAKQSLYLGIKRNRYGDLVVSGEDNNETYVHDVVNEISMLENERAIAEAYNEWDLRESNGRNGNFYRKKLLKLLG